MSALLTAAIVAAIVAGLAGAGASIYGASKNYDSQVDTNNTNYQIQQMVNSQNLQIARETNAANIEMTKNRHQWEVQDLAAAGLNPVLSAGGQGAPMASLHTPTMQAARMQAPQLDTSGISSAMNSITSMAMMMAMMSNQNSIAAENRALRSELSAQQAPLREAKTKYYNARTTAYKKSLAKAAMKADSKRAINSAKQLDSAKRKYFNKKALDEAMPWSEIIKELNGK